MSDEQDSEIVMHHSWGRPRAWSSEFCPDEILVRPDRNSNLCAFKPISKPDAPWDYITLESLKKLGFYVK